MLLKQHVNSLSTLAEQVKMHKESLDDAKILLDSLRNIRRRPHTLTKNSLIFASKLFAAINKDNNIHLEQCKKWRKEKLSAIEISQIDEIEQYLVEMEAVHIEIISIADFLQDKMAQANRKVH